MQEVRLRKLSLRNFKGIKELDLDLNGNDASIYGQNASGKTTIMDGFFYLLFNKDSLGSTTFEIKTLNPDGTAKSKLEHSVEAILVINKTELTLKKTYKEKHTKKRGSAKEEFTGHETNYWIDGVPSKKNEFDAKVSSIIDENIFRLLTDPKHFNNLHWGKRRALLLEICGGTSTDEITAIDNQRKVVKAKQAEINKKLKEIPARVSEVQQMQPDIADVKDADELDKDLEFLREQQGEKRNELTRVNTGGEIAVKTKALREIEGELQAIFNEHYADMNKQIKSKTDDLSDHRTRILARKGDLATTAAAIEHLSSTIPNVESSMAMLRAKYQEIYKQELIYREQSVCPACDQPLPRERLAEAKERALADFNGKKAQQLEDIQAEGKQLAARLEENKAEKARLEEIFTKGDVGLGECEAAYSELEAEIEAIRASATDITSNPAHQAKLAEKTAIEAEIEALKLGNGEAIETIEHEIFELQQSIDTLGGTKAELEQRTKGTERIAELEKQEKLLAKEYERLSKELFDAEEALRQKVAQLDEAISSKFKLVRFNLFKEQINEGIKETCDTTLNGVPYESANSAGRTQAGCDIITTMQQHYQVSAPIFIDNRESCLWIPEMNCQVISLIVSSADKSLRVETKASAVA